MPDRDLKSGAKRNERLQVMLSDVELKVIDAWRFEAMMPSRAAAIRALIRKGLESTGMDLTSIVESAEEIDEVPRSDDVGIV